MNKRKVCVVITARPSYSRVKTVLQAIKDHPMLELQLVVSGSALLDRYGTAVNNIQRDGFLINSKVFNVLEGENLMSAVKTTGLGILELSTVFDNLKPDVVVTIADRFETMATAISAAYMNIPLAHIQGGEVTGSIDEKVRHAITKLSDIHFVASPLSRDRVIRMGEKPDSVFLTGCPSIDLAYETLQNGRLEFNPFEKYKGVGLPVDLSNGYLVVLQHPVTTEYELSRKHIEQTINAVSELNLPIMMFWPNVDAGSDGTSKGIRAFRETRDASKFHFFKNMDPYDFLILLNNSKCLIGNSSVGIRECSYLGVPVVNIGSRQSGREKGINIIDTDYIKDDIIKAIKSQIEHGRYSSEAIYGSGNAGRQIAELLSAIPLTYDKKLYY